MPTVSTRSLLGPLGVVLLVGATTIPACGSDDAPVFVAGPDASGDGPSGSSSGSSGAAEAGIACGSTTCGAGQTCTGGSCTCPPYMTACGGACIPTVTDPKNCGGCGVACTGTLACSGGVCSETCLPGETKCGNSCVQTHVDDAHCGACGVRCGPGTGCVDGACHPVVAVGTTGPNGCGGAGQFSPTADPAQGGCLGDLAQTVFRWTLCSCKDAQFSGDWLMDAYDSTRGPYRPGGIGAGLGANESYGASGTGELWGTMWIAGPGGVAPSLAHVVKSDLRSGGELKAGGSSTFTIGGDAYVLGDASGDGTLAIAGTLYQAAGKSVSGNVTRAAYVNTQPLTVAPPCDFCGSTDAVPIASIVAAHRPPANDNAAIQLNPAALAGPSSPIRLDLPCGEYYLSSITSSDHVTIVAHGRTALYVDGDVSPNGITLAADPDGELNVFIAGSLGASGVVRFGSPSYPAAMRVYVGGTSGVTISDEVSIAGNLYVPNGAVTYSSSAEQFGAVYAGNFSTSKDLKLHYDLAVVRAGAACAGPGSDGSTSSSGATSSSGGAASARACTTCNECGNQACISGRCGGSCGANDTCCAPLICIKGTCQPNVR